ncbi:MAG: DNA polymerase III subunit alpha, partial [Microcella pacifica]
DFGGDVSVMFLGKTHQEFGARLASDTIVVIRGRVNHRDDGVSLHANSLQLPDLGLPTDTGPLVLTLREARATVDVLSELDSVLGRHRGGTEVRLRLLRGDTARVFELPHRVDPSAGFFGEVKSLLGPRALA